MILGYVTSGFGNHKLEDCLHILADIGYQSVAITLDTHHLNPYAQDFDHNLESVRQILRERNLRCTIETGARFLLDPKRKHKPALISEDQTEREKRIDFISKSIEIAARLEADCVSLFSGVADENTSRQSATQHLVESMRSLLEIADTHQIPLSFEPEPGHLIESMADFHNLCETLDHPRFGLTLDIGHLHCLDDGDLIDHLNRWHRLLCNVHLEDMRRNRHEHLFFGEGDINFIESLNALASIGYRGPVHVELSRHSHDAVEIAQHAHEFLSAIWPESYD